MVEFHFITFDMKKILLVFLLIFLNATSLLAETLADTVTQVQHTYDAMTSLRFTFHQTTSGEMTGRPQQGNGWAVFLRKSGEQKMRWEYLEPDKQVIVSDGITFKMYFQKLQQMIVTSADRMSADLTYAFFTGRGNLLYDFKIEKPDEQYSESTDGNTVIKLIPRYPQQQVENIHIWVDKKYLIRRISIKDHFGTITMLNLSHIEINALDKAGTETLNALFSFIPPDHTEIIEQ